MSAYEHVLSKYGVMIFDDSSALDFNSCELNSSYLHYEGKSIF